MKFLIRYKKYNDIIFLENPIEFLSQNDMVQQINSPFFRIFEKNVFS